MTGQWGDLANADVLLTCGCNNAENHPASMRWVDRARENGATFIVVDPRFTRTAAVADIYCPIRPGTDIAFYGGMINYIFEHDRWQHEYCLNYTNLSYLINPDFSFDPETGFFSGYDAQKGSYDKSTWSYQTDSETTWDNSATGAYAWMTEPGVPAFNPLTVKTPKKDPTLQDPNCVYQIMKKHYERYDLDTVCSVCGMSKEALEQVYDVYTSTGATDKAGTILYALGQTQHSTGVGNTRSMSIVQLLLGNIGVPGGQLAALRGEPNVQGCTDMCIAPGDMTGYLKWPVEGKDTSIAAYCENETAVDGYWSNTPKFLVSYLKSFFGDAATAENDYGYNWLPKLDNAAKRSLQNTWHLMEQGVVKGYMFFGQNPMQSQANASYYRRVAENLDWLVFDDMYYTETAEFWKSPENKDRASEIKTECYFLPIASMFEKCGTIINSGRVMQWRNKCTETRGDSKADSEVLMLIHKKLVELYEKEGGAFPDPILNAKWDYEGADGKPDHRKIAWELNGYSTDGATEDFQSNTPKLLDAFSKLKADGSTASACWIYTGYYGNALAPMDPAQQNTGRRDNTDYGDLHIFPKWAFSWPANRRILYNRASCDMQGKPWQADKTPVSWNGTAWDTIDVPDFVASKSNADGTTTPVEPNNKAFMMRWEQNACLFSNVVNDMPIPEHYEPFESPVSNQLNGSAHNPAILFADDPSIRDTKGSVDEYPYIATTYSFTEHWSSGAETHTIPVLNEMMPEQFAEIPAELAAEKGINNGDTVRIFNKRGSVKVAAIVTKRVPPLEVNGKTHYAIGIVHDWGYSNVFTNGDIVNDLVPNVGDPTSFIQESKAFLVGLEKA
jgi:formate dehydrogenase major subunit